MATQNEQQAHYYMQIQPDWQELAAAQEEGESGSIEERCWLDVYERSVRLDSRTNDEDDEKLRVQIQSAASAHYELELNATSVAQRVAPKDASSSHQQQQHLVEIAKRENQWIEVHAHIGTHDEQQQQRIVRTVFQAPTATMDVTATSSGSGASKRQLHAVDVSNDEKLIAVGGADGFCALWDALDRTEAFLLTGHLLDVTRVRFFPSSKVLLTGSLDFTLRIWSAETGQCAAALKGHRGGIEDIAILGRGRNVLSSSSDGLIHLWSCGSQEVIAKWGNDAQSAVHCLSVFDDSVTKTLAGSSQQDAPEPHDLEAETEGKVLFAGLENSEVLGVDIRMRQLVMNLQGTGSPILSCAATATGSAPLLLTGSGDGLLTTWDLRNTSSPLQLLSRSSSPINRLVVSSSSPKAPFVTAWTAHGDGVCCNWSHLSTGTGDNSDNAVSTTELTGPLYDPVRDVAIAPRTGRVLTVCRDGLLRDYIPHYLL